MVDNILVNVSNFNCYVNDIVINSVTEESHIKHLENVFALLFKHGFCIRLEKCSLMQPLVELLEPCIDEEGIHTDERKIHTIRDAYLPSSRKQLSSFLGISSCYSKSIINFEKIARPLSEKTSEKSSSLVVTTAKHRTIPIEIVGTCMYLGLLYICIRHTALHFLVKIVLILRMSCENATRCTVLTNIKARAINGRSDRSGYTRESTTRSAPFPFSAKKI